MDKDIIIEVSFSNRKFRIDYDNKTDTYELMEVCTHYDYLIETGDIFTVANRVLEIYENSIID